MSQKSRWAEIEVSAPGPSVEAVGQGMISAGCAGYSVKDEHEPCLIIGYLPVDDRLEARLYEIKDHTAKLPEFGLPAADPDVTVRYVDEEDWATAWKAYFKPIPIGKRIVITPPWEKPELNSDQIAVVVDPGMAFGTGSHPTTQLCLAAIDEFLKPGDSVGDLGTGSGILAIAAKLLGAGLVEGSDIDPLAVKIAQDNAEVNGVDIHFTIDAPKGQYDLVTANILADVIIDLKSILIEMTKRGGVLVVSGIIDTRCADVLNSLSASGLELIEERAQSEWRAIIFRRPA
jgi:ribosomal protein L11 methyltransferase